VVLTDPDTTVGTAPLAEVAWMEDLPDLIAMRYTAGERWTSVRSGVVDRPVPPESDLGLYLAERGRFDVVSVTFADRFGSWGFLDLMREGSAFTPGEKTMLGSLTRPVAAGLRRARAATFVVPDGSRDGPRPWRAEFRLGSDLRVRGHSREIDTDLRALLPRGLYEPPLPVVAYHVAAQLLAVEAGRDHNPASARMAAAPGEWISVTAERVGSDIAVAFAPLPTTERVALFCRTSGLSPRETAVLTGAADGGDLDTIARILSITTNTVHDHLKSIFDKTGVRSRRELIARARGQ